MTEVSLVGDTEATEQAACPAWCTQRDHDTELGRTHYGPKFGLVEVEGNEVAAAGCLGHNSLDSLDDLSAADLRQLAADALAAAEWLEGATTALRGNICPSWCGGEHRADRGEDGRPVHRDDHGMFHRSRDVDAWHVLYGEDGGVDSDLTQVWIEGKRHDFDDDYPDTIRAVNVCPGFETEIGLQVPDARRLGEALIRACDLVNSGDRTATLS